MNAVALCLQYPSQTPTMAPLRSIHGDGGWASTEPYHQKGIEAIPTTPGVPF